MLSLKIKEAFTKTAKSISRRKISLHESFLHLFIKAASKPITIGNGGARGWHRVARAPGAHKKKNPTIINPAYK